MDIGINQRRRVWRQTISWLMTKTYLKILKMSNVPMMPVNPLNALCPLSTEQIILHDGFIVACCIKSKYIFEKMPKFQTWVYSVLDVI